MQQLTLTSKKVVTGIMLGLVFLMPYHSYAATTWQPHTNAELIAFLYGVVVQLQIQLDELRANPPHRDTSDDDHDTDDRPSSSGRPQVSTGDADDESANSVTVSTVVDMRSYGYGSVFFAYGTSQSKVSAVSRENDFDDIELDDKLDLYIINNGFAGRGTLVTGLYSLTAGTDYYYRACVEYFEDADDDDTDIICGDVEKFTTKRR